MKAQGTDGLSRGQLREGVSLGRAMATYCPWAQTACERSQYLIPWLKSWIGDDAEVLRPSDWFNRGHDHDGGYYDGATEQNARKGYWRIKARSGKFIWVSPPGAADVMIEELRKARLKRRDSTHFVVIPRLFTTL